MAVAFDAATAIAVTAGNISTSHTPAGTPRAILAFVYSGTGGGSNPPVSGTPTYGGVNMTQVAGSPNVSNAVEDVGISAFFLGSSVPTGAQTFSATNGTGGFDVAGAIISLTASADCETVDVDATINSTSLADPSVTLSLGGRTCFAAIGFAAGNNAPTGYTPLTNWTSIVEDLSNDTGGGVYRYDIIGTTDVTAGYTAAADDQVMIAVAVSEVQSATASRRTLSALGTRSGSRQMVRL